MKTIAFSVDAGAILTEAIRHWSGGTDTDSPGMVMGLHMIRRGLGEIATRAIELGDEKLLATLQLLGAVNPT